MTGVQTCALPICLQLAGDDVADIYVNGRFIGTHYGGGGATTFDTSSALLAGVNLLAIRLTNNTHNGHDIYSGGDHPGLLYHLEASYARSIPFAVAPAMTLNDQPLTFTMQPLLRGKLPFRYAIDLGDGGSAGFSENTNITHTYTTPGVYTAVVTARDQLDSITTDELTVTVLASDSNLLANRATTSYQNGYAISYYDESGAGVELSQAVDLSILKTVTAGGAVPGQAVTYQFVVTNNGPDAATGAAVTDTVTATITDVTWTCISLGGSCGNASGSGNVLSETVDLPAGATATYTLLGTIDPAATGTLTNTASTTPPAGITDLVTSNNSSTITSTLTPQVTLSVIKTSTPNPGLAAGRAVRYTILVNNSGSSDATGVSVVDTFPVELENVIWTCVASSGSTCTASGSGNINDTTTILAGGSLTYTAVGTVASGTAAGTVIANTATATYAATPVSDTDNNTVVAKTSLTATKDALNSLDASSRTLPFVDADSNGGISPGDTLKYQVVIANGANVAYNVLYSDIPNVNTTLVVGSVTCAPGCTITHGNTAGDTTVGASIASIPANNSVTLTYQVTVNDPLPFQSARLANHGYVAASNAASIASDDPNTGESQDPTVVTLKRGSISGVTWLDNNNDGVRDAGEPMLTNLPVTLYYAGEDGTWGTSDDQAAYSYSDGSGAYSFENLAAGIYRVGFYAPLGYQFSPLGVDNKADPATGQTTDISLSTNMQTSNISAGEVSQFDFGNLPSAYGLNLLANDGARHILGDTLLGFNVQAEADGTSSADLTIMDDDEGIVRTPGVNWVTGVDGGSIDVTVQCATGCYLSGWIDWGNDHTFNLSDRILLDQPLVQGSQSIEFDIPAGVTFPTTVYARFRLYTTSTSGAAQPIGAATNGEVEDYKWEFSPNAVTLARFSAGSHQPIGLLVLFGFCMGLLLWRKLRIDER